VTVVVSDGQLSASNSYTVSVTGLAAGSRSFTNLTSINVPDLAAGSPYPSTINVSGLGGSVSNLTVTLRSLNYQWGRDLDVLLVSPGGQAMIVMSDAGTGPTATNANLTFSNNAASFLNQSNILLSGIYKPTDYPPADAFPSPAPAAPYATNFSVFLGQPANGTWSLYAVDDGSGDTGSISGGWSLTITTQAAPVTNTAPTISAPSNQVVVVNNGTGALPFTVGDAETAPSNLVVSVFTSNSVLAPTNQIVLGGNGANRTVAVTPGSNQLGSATISLSVSDGSLTASNSFVVTVTPAALTVSENSASRGYGLTNPVLSGSVSGLQAGDNITASFSSPATTNSPVGSYPIMFTLADPGSKLGNYVITTNNGTLTVTQAVLVASANNASRAYGQPNPVFTISYTGFVNGEGTNVMDLLPEASSSATNTSAPGGYVIAVAGGSDDNYAINRVNGVLSITAPGPVTLTAVAFLGPTSLRIAGTGDANVTYKIQASADLSGWTEIGTAAADNTGAFEFVDLTAGGFDARYYRVAMP
jgi:subtilisin-like proprotein convertase family protein